MLDAAMGGGKTGRSCLSVVVPTFNEARNLGELAVRVSKVLAPLDIDYRLVFVDDGSTDESVEVITNLHRDDARVALVRLSRNFGHQAAIQAGLEVSLGHPVVIMDGDLQDPPEVLPNMIDLWRQGYEVVYAVRRKRKEHVWKRMAYKLFYRLLDLVAEVRIPLDSGDFCLLDKKVVAAMAQCKESNRFIRGIRSWVGFRQIGLEYERDARLSGAPKYSLKKLFKLAIDGIFSFSLLPLRLSVFIGIGFFLLSSMYLVYVVYAKLVGQDTPPGWASLIVAVLFMGGIQLIMLGIIGEYLGRTYEEAKQRPHYVVRETLGLR